MDDQNQGYSGMIMSDQDQNFESVSPTFKGTPPALLAPGYEVQDMPESSYIKKGADIKGLINFLEKNQKINASHFIKTGHVNTQVPKLILSQLKIVI